MRKSPRTRINWRSPKRYTNIEEHITCPVADPLDQFQGTFIDYPDNDRLCEEAVWLSQTLLLGSKRDMDDIANAIAKIAENKDQLA